MRFCTKCGSPVSGRLRYCTRCGMEIGSAPERYTTEASTARAEMAGAAAAGADTVQAEAVQAGSVPVIPAQVGVVDAESAGGGLADAGSGSVTPSDPALPEAGPLRDGFTGPADQEEPSADETAADELAADHPRADQTTADPAGADQSAVDQPVADPQHSLAGPEAATGAGMPEDDGLLRLVRIGAEADEEPWAEDPWLPGSRRPDRRALVIGVVIIAGLLAVASTAWLVGTNQPLAGGAHGSHVTRSGQPGSGHAQTSQALSGHPGPGLTPTSPPAPAPTRTGPARSGQSGSGQSGSGQSGSGQGSSAQGGHGQTGTGHQGTGRSGTGHSATAHPGTSHTGTHRTGSGQAGSSGAASGRSGSSQSGSRPGGSGPGGPGQAGSSPSRTGQTGSGHGTTQQAPHPRRPAGASGGGGKPRRAATGIVSITHGLSARADARRVAVFLDRYFAAVNHRQYLAYASLFTQRHQLSPREFAWGYRTSHDSKAILAGISALKGGLKATVTFTSHQEPAESPDHSSCIDWKITLFLHRNGPAYLIGMPPPGYRAGLQACRFAPRHGSQGRARQPTTRHPGPAQPGSKHRGSKHERSKHEASKHEASKHEASKHEASKHGSSKHGRRKHR